MKQLLKMIFVLLAGSCLGGLGGAAVAQGAIQGTLFAPSGGDVYGTIVIACYPTSDGEDCNESLTGFVQISQGGLSAPFEIRNLQAGQYLLIAWQDVNGNGDIDDGEPLTIYLPDGQTPALLTPPAQDIELRFDPVAAQQPQQAQPQAPAQPGALPAELAGYWRRGSVSTVDFYNPMTGAWAPPSGSGGSYTFNPDGTYEHGSMVQSSLYSCTMTLFGYHAGQAFAEGDILMLQQRVNKFKSQDTCRAEWNYERDDDPETEYFLWETGLDEYGSRVLALTRLILNASGQLEYDPEYPDPWLYYAE